MSSSDNSEKPIGQDPAEGPEPVAGSDSAEIADEAASSDQPASDAGEPSDPRDTPGSSSVPQVEEESPPPFDAGEDGPELDDVVGGPDRIPTNPEEPPAAEAAEPMASASGAKVAEAAAADTTVAETKLADTELADTKVAERTVTERAGSGRAEPGDDSWMTSGEGHPRRWAILGVLVVSLIIVVLDNTVLNIALPTIQADLHATQSELVWAVDSYILVFASLLFTWGVLGDRYGRRRILTIGLLIFMAASLASAFAVSPLMLIVTRGLMGVGGAAVMPVTLAMITVIFPPAERGKAIGVWAASVGAAVALGPVLGGLLLEHPEWSSWATNNDWGSVFLINIPIIALGLFGIWRIVPESRNPVPQKLDLIGLGLSFAGLSFLIFGIVRASAERSWTAPSVVVPALIGIVIIIAFLVYEARSSHKSFDVRLFRNRGYAVSLSAVSLTFFAMSGMTFSLPFFFQVLRDMSTLQSGAAFLPFAIGQFISAPRSGHLVDRFGYRLVMGIGLGLVSITLLGLRLMQIDTNVWLIMFGFFLFGLGMGLVIAPATSLMQNVLPLARAGAGSAVQNTVRQVFGALGIAIVGTILGTQYAQNVAGSLEALGDRFPADLAEESVVATDRLLDAAVSQGAPADQIEPIRQAAYDTYLNAAHITLTLSAVVVVIALLLVLFALPKVRPPQHGDRPPEDTWDEPGDKTLAVVAQEQGLPESEADLAGGSGGSDGPGQTGRGKPSGKPA